MSTWQGLARTLGGAARCAPWALARGGAVPGTAGDTRAGQEFFVARGFLFWGLRTVCVPLY